MRIGIEEEHKFLLLIGSSRGFVMIYEMTLFFEEDEESSDPLVCSSIKFVKQLQLCESAIINLTSNMEKEVLAIDSDAVLHHIDMKSLQFTSESNSIPVEGIFVHHLFIFK